MEEKLTRPSEVQKLLGELGVRPSKALGQNFLIDANILRIMVEAAALTPADVVLEIGPGLGVLTEALLARAGQVIAVEKDARLFTYLQSRFSGHARLNLLHADVMEIDLEKMLAGGVTKMVSNLPYAVGTRVLVDLIESATPPGQMVATLQWDVGERLTARPGAKAYGALSIWAQAYYQVHLRKVVAPTCFLPAPEVRSAILEMIRRADSDLRPSSPAYFHHLIKQAFMHRRKQLGKFLLAVAAPAIPAQERPAVLDELGIDPRRRPESLSVSEWIHLSNRFCPSGHG